MKVPADVPETIPRDPFGYGGVVKSRILSPIVVNTGKFVDPHEDTKSHVCSLLGEGDVCLLVEPYLSHNLCIPI